MEANFLKEILQDLTPSGDHGTGEAMTSGMPDQPPEESKAFLYRWALELLARGDLPEARLIRRAVNAGRRRPGDEHYAAFTPEGGRALVLQLRAEGRLDERALAQRWLNSLLGQKAGLLAVQHKLIARGLDPRVVAGAVAEFRASGAPQDLQRITALTRQRQAQLQRRYAGDRKAHAKVQQGLRNFLGLKGYTADEARRILAALA